MQRIVLAYGEVLWDMLPSGPQLGGAPFNFCYRVNSLGDVGWMVSRLGRDELGRRAWERIATLGMDTRFVQWDEEAPTGTVNVDLSDPNRPDFTIVPGVAYDNTQTNDDLLKAAGLAECICFGTLMQRTAIARRTLRRLLDAAQNAARLLDINLRKDCYTRETILDSLRAADVLKLNDDEAQTLARMFEFGDAHIPEFCARMREQWGLREIVVTLGERGAFASDAAEGVHVPGYRVELVDTCGSGDAFTAGYLHRRMRGEPLAACCELGNALGAMVAGQSGATAPIPPESVRAFILQEHERVEDARLADYA